MKAKSRAALITFVIAGACTSPDRAATPSDLEPASHVVLAESDSAFLSGPVHITMARDGAVFVSDAMNAVVLEFSRDGRFVRRFGTRGSGPGELGVPLASGLLNDSVLIVTDLQEQRTSLFSRATGAFIRSVRTESTPSWVESAGDTVWIFGVAAGRRTSAAMWEASSDSVHYFGPVPVEYERDTELMYMYPFAVATRDGFRTVLGFSGHNSLLVLDETGVAQRAVEVPVVRRRGVAAEVLQRFASRSIDDTVLARSISSVVGLHTLPSGDFAVLHLDATMEDGLITGDAFLTVISSDFTSACVDARIAGKEDGRAWFAFHADTLFALQQSVVNEVSAETSLSAYPIDGTGCTPRSLQVGTARGE